MYLHHLQLKLDEALKAVLPIVGIVLVLSLSIAPMPTAVLLAFLFGGFLLIIGMMFFSLGAELSMEAIGQAIGAKLTRTRKIVLILAVSAALGMLVTVSEPDLQVLARQVDSIPANVLIYSVAAGTGLFLAVAVGRMFFSVSFRMLLLIFYAGVMTLSLFAPGDFLAVAFDSGGVTTGPMTVPFIMAFGIGICSVRSDGDASGDSFGLIALCSIGPILAVLILSIVYSAGPTEYAAPAIPDVSQSVELGRMFFASIPGHMKEISLALLPIIVFFGIFQVISLRLTKKSLLTVFIGLFYTYAGLVLFLTGVNTGFMPAGSYLGGMLAAFRFKWIIVPIGMLIGYFIVKAEPAVYVLMRQVEELTDGAISGRSLQLSLSAGVALSVGLAMLRVLTGLPILWIIIPGYLIALLLSFFVPNIFTSIAFDSGGVASGPMTATFLLPFAKGACLALGGNVITDAFGVVALVAMTPLVTIQILGVIYKLRQKKGRTGVIAVPAAVDDFAIINL